MSAFAYFAKRLYQLAPTKWQIELLRDDGVTRLALLDRCGPFQCTSVTNNWGSFSLVLPKGFPRSLITRDRRVRFWRKPAGGVQYLEFEGLIKRMNASEDSGGFTRTIGGPSMEFLLDGRVIAAPSGDAKASKTGAADNLMKAFVSEQMSTSATAERNISTTYFTIQGNSGLAPTITKECAYRKLITVLRELSDAARKEGTEVYFRVFPGSPLQFRTYIGQAGTDRTGTNTGLIFGPRRGNLKNPSLNEDWMKEYNHVIGLGLGQGAARDVQWASDETRAGFSLLSYREDTIQHNYASGVLDAAKAEVIAGKPEIRFAGDLVSTLGSVYGKDFNKFDKVRVDFDDRQFAANVKAVTCSVDQNGKETIKAKAEAYL